MHSELKPFLSALGLFALATVYSPATHGQTDTSNSLVNPGFEEPSTVGAGLPAEIGQWSGDASSIVLEEAGISPRSGTRMLRFDGTHPPKQGAPGQVSQVWQLLAPADLNIDPNREKVTANASVWVNRVAGMEKTDRLFKLTLQTHEGEVSSFVPEAATATRSVEIVSDDNPETWERLRVRLTVPSTTTFIAIALEAEEDLSDNDQGEFDGHYADDAAVSFSTTVTEPLTISGLDLQDGQLSLEWTGGIAPFVIQGRANLGTGTWNDMGATDQRAMTLSLKGESQFFRIAGSGGQTEALPFKIPLFDTPKLTPQDEAVLLEQLDTIYPDARRRRLVDLNLDAVKPIRVANELKTLPIQLRLFDDTVLNAVNERVNRLSRDRFSWIGRIEDEPSSRVVLSFKGSQATGLIQNGTDLFQVTSLENGQYGVVQVNQNAFPQEAPPDAPPLPDRQLAQSALGDTEVPGRRFINVMVVYTEEAADAAGDIELSIQNAIDVTNASYEDSGISQRLYLAHTQQVDYNEGTGTDIKTHRNRLQDPDDGFMDEVHDWRNDYQADLVALIIENSAFCGVAYIMEQVSPSFQAWGFSVTVRSCAVGNFSFAHELGHNMGARHDRFVDDTDNKPFAFSHGHVNVGGLWRTIMAYDNACEAEGNDCTRIGRWSNPNLDYLGDPTGVSSGNDAADNHRALISSDFTVSQFRTLGLNEAGDRFGAAVAMGDFNGDGLADLAVGAPHEAPGSDPESGLIFLYAGTPFGLAPWKALSQEGGLGANEAGDLFGFSLASGDFDGDGFDDLAVGAPGEAPRSDPKSGIVFLFKGSEDGLSHWHSVTERSLGNNEEGDEFGYSLATGDFDRDGKDDLAVGTPGNVPPEAPQSGVVFVFQGTDGDLSPWHVLDQDELEQNENGDRFGEAVIAGDFNGDGTVDLAVGAPGETIGDGEKAGAVFVFQGSPSGLTPSRLLDQGGIGINEADDRFGKALAAGDFNRDGMDDLAVGAPGEAPGDDPKGGYVYVYQGSDAGLTAWTGFSQRGLGINEEGDLFGASVSVGDFNGDGFDDLAVGAPGEAPGADPESGALFVYEGSPLGLLPWDGLGQRGLGENESGDEFGFSLAAGDVDGDGLSDIVVGAPGESPASDPQSGFVFAYHGQASGKPLSPWFGITEEQ